MKRLAVVLLLAFPGAAAAEPPANDAPAGAVEFSEYTAANGTPSERQGVIDLTEATADADVPRCLGPTSFAKTVWFKVPAGTVPRSIVVEASSPSGGSSEIPDVALFVGGQTAEPQACDGAASAGPLATSAAGVTARVPAGAEVLVQIGRAGGQAEQRVVASLRVTDLEAVPAPAGDLAGDAPVLALGRAVAVPVAGATLTAEDPAQPACPAAATVWRRTRITDSAGRHRIVAPAAGSITAFVGAAPSAANARACANDAALAVRAKPGDTLWTRLGDGADGTVRIVAPKARLGVKVKRRVLRVRARGRTLRGVSVRFAGKTRRFARIRAGRTKRVRLVAGRYRVVVKARGGLRKTRRVRLA